MRRNQEMAPETDEQGFRTCIASGVRKPKEDMVRFVIGPDGNIVPDLEAKLPGRGLWLSAERDMIHTACAKNLFAKRARCNVRVDTDLAERVEALLARRCVELLQLARRAGLFTAGHDEVRRRLERDSGGMLLAASDGAKGGRDKFKSVASDMPVSDALTGDELGQAVGRERIVHALVASGGMANKLSRELQRLAGMRPLRLAA